MMDSIGGAVDAMDKQSGVAEDTRHELIVHISSECCVHTFCKVCSDVKAVRQAIHSIEQARSKQVWSYQDPERPRLLQA